MCEIWSGMTLSKNDRHGMLDRRTLPIKTLKSSLSLISSSALNRQTEFGSVRIFLQGDVVDRFWLGTRSTIKLDAK